MAEKTKSSFGLDKNVAGALCYVGGWVTGLIFYLSEKNDKEIRFHGLQSILFFGFLNVIMFIPFLGWTLKPIVSLLGFIAYLVLIIKAYQGEHYKLPMVGDIAQKYV